MELVDGFDHAKFWAATGDIFTVHRGEVWDRFSQVGYLCQNSPVFRGEVC